VSGADSAFLTPEVRVLKSSLFRDSFLHREDFDEIRDQAFPHRLRRSRMSRRHRKGWSWRKDTARKRGFRAWREFYSSSYSFSILLLCTFPMGSTGHVLLFMNSEKSMLIHSLPFSYGILMFACVKFLVA